MVMVNSDSIRHNLTYCFATIRVTEVEFVFAPQGFIELIPSINLESLQPQCIAKLFQQGVSIASIAWHAHAMGIVCGDMPAGGGHFR